MGCLVLNENVENAILDFLENKAESCGERNPFAYDPKAKYSPATLVNEWYEDRFQKIPLNSDLPLTTEYKDHYTELCKYTIPHRKDYFKMIFDSEVSENLKTHTKSCDFDNDMEYMKFQGLGQEILMDQLQQPNYNNFTTMYDLCYNHLVKGLCGPFPRKYIKGKYLPETDLTLIYGNLTQWGLKEKVIPKKEPDCIPLPPMPEYKSEFKNFDRREVKRLNDFPFRGRKKSDL